MAGNIVGDAYVVVRAVTSQVENDIKNAFKGVDKIGEDAGKELSNSLSKGVNQNGGFSSIGASLSDIFGDKFIKGAENASEAFTHMTRAGYVLAPAISAISSIIGVLITGLISLGSVVIAGAVPALLNFGGALGALGIAALTAKVAFEGVLQAIQAGNKATIRSAADVRAKAAADLAAARAQQDLQTLYISTARSQELAERALSLATRDYTLALASAREELRKLALDSEGAALDEKKAALELGKARETLARVSDLPPNSRVRKEAELAFAQADLNYRKAIDSNNVLKRQEAINAKLGSDPEAQAKGQLSVTAALTAQNDAQYNLNKTMKDNAVQVERAQQDTALAQKAADNFWALTSAATAYAAALSQLSPEAQSFVKYVVSLKSAFKELQGAAGSELFPKLEVALGKIVKELFPALKPLLAETGGVLGDIAIKIAGIFTEPANIEKIKSIWKSSDVALGFFGDALSNVLGLILDLWAAYGPYIERFAKWTAGLTAGWKATLEADIKTGKFKETMDKLWVVMEKLGKIFGNTFGGLANLIMQNIGPGSGGEKFLNYFIDITQKFKDLKSIDGKSVKQFFSDAADNGIKLLEALGKIIFAFIRLADNKGFGVFLDQLKKAIDIFSGIGEQMDIALPSIGAMIVSFATFVKNVISAESVKIFFTTLKTILDDINKFLQSDIGKALTDLSNKLLPFLAALALVGEIASFGFKVIFGQIYKLISVFGKLGEAFRITATFLADFGPLGELIAGSLGTVVAAGAAFIAVFILMWEKSKIFRDAIKDLIDGVFSALKDSWNNIKKAIDDAKPSIDKVTSVFKFLGDVLGSTIVPIFKVVLVTAIKIATGVITDLIKVIGGIVGGFSSVWNGIKPIIDKIIGLVEGLVSGIKNVLGGVGGAFKSAFTGLVDFVKVPINAVIDLWNNSLGKVSVKLPKVLGFGGGTIGFPTIPRLATGGTIYPQAGGVLANIAEAGRPERVEPLDPNGLSARDKAWADLIVSKNGGVGGGVVVNVYPSAGMDERELAALVSRQLTYAMRSGAA